MTLRHLDSSLPGSPHETESPLVAGVRAAEGPLPRLSSADRAAQVSTVRGLQLKAHLTAAEHLLGGANGTRDARCLHVDSRSVLTLINAAGHTQRPGSCVPGERLQGECRGGQSASTAT